jgi:ribosomal protein S18 acetylase RimI-like enzyme
VSETVIRQVTLGDLDRCFAIESVCYGPEAATRKRIKKRIVQFPRGFLVAEHDRQLVGFVNSGATHKDDISDEALKDMIGHDPTGKNIVIFSLAVSPQFQSRGISKKLMLGFIDTSRVLNKDCILLLCKSELIQYYRQYGFIDRGQSKSKHAGMQWHEMYLCLTDRG